MPEFSIMPSRRNTGLRHVLTAGVLALAVGAATPSAQALAQLPAGADRITPVAYDTATATGPRAASPVNTKRTPAVTRPLHGAAARTVATGHIHPVAAKPRRGTTRPTAGTSGTASAKAPTSNRWVMGYYVGYMRDQYPLDAVDWNSMTHVAVSAATPRADGSLDTSFYQQDTRTGEAWAASVAAAAHAHGRKAILMLGGAGSRDAFAAAAAPTRRSAFAATIVSTATRLGFDGVDVDWEPMVAADVSPAVALGQELRARRPGMLLTIPVGAVNTNLPQLSVLPSIAALGTTYDQVNVMSYGMNGGWEGWSAWHSSALFGAGTTTPMSVDSSIAAYAAAGIPRAKLGVGIGFFGTCMSGVTAPRQATPTMRVLADDNVMSFANIMSSYYRSDLARWDDVAKVPYLVSPTPIGPAGCTFVSYEDSRSIAEKAAYAKSSGLGGVIIWNINEGYVPPASTRTRSVANTSLLAAVGRSFLG